jgi:hypothetical protein
VNKNEEKSGTSAGEEGYEPGTVWILEGVDLLREGQAAAEKLHFSIVAGPSAATIARAAAPSEAVGQTPPAWAEGLTLGHLVLQALQPPAPEKSLHFAGESNFHRA